MKNPQEEFKNITKEQLIEEFLHQEEIIQNVSNQNGKLNTELVSAQLMLSKAHQKIEKMEQQMMEYLESGDKESK